MSNTPSPVPEPSDVAPDDDRPAEVDPFDDALPDHLDAPFETPVPDVIDQLRDVPVDEERR